MQHQFVHEKSQGVYTRLIGFALCQLEKQSHSAEEFCANIIFR